MRDLQKEIKEEKERVNREFMDGITIANESDIDIIKKRLQLLEEMTDRLEKAFLKNIANSTNVKQE